MILSSVHNRTVAEYDNRANKLLNRAVLRIRAAYYRVFIVPTIQRFIEETSKDGSTIINWKIVEVGCGAGDKMAQTIDLLLWDSFQFIWIEPSVWMRNIAKERFKNDKKVIITEWSAEDLNILKNESVDMIFYIQILHHLRDKITAIQEAYRVLRPGGHIYILDTFTPPSVDTLCWRFNRKVFEIMSEFYANIIKTSEYHNVTIWEMEQILTRAWFKLNTRYSCWFQTIAGRPTWLDFINQIIATK